MAKVQNDRAAADRRFPFAGLLKALMVALSLAWTAAAAAPEAAASSSGTQPVATQPAATQPAGPAAWPQMDVAGLAHEAGLIKDAQLKQQLAGYVAQKYAAAGVVDWNEWTPLAAQVGDLLPAAARDAMRQSLKAWAQKPQSLATMPLKQMSLTRVTMAKLGAEEDLSWLTVRWTEQTTRLEELTVAQLGGLCAGASGSGQQQMGKAARAKLAEHVAGKYLKERAAVRSVGGSWWMTFVRSLRSELSDEAQRQWRMKLSEALVDDRAVLAGMKGNDAMGVLLALQLLGDSRTVQLSAWYVQNATAIGEMDRKSLAALGMRVQRSGVAEAQRRLMQYVEETYLSDGSTARALELAEWSALAPHTWPVAAEKKKAWVEALGARYAGEALTNLGAAEARSLVEALGSLEGRGPAVAWKWLNESPNAAAAKAEDLGNLEVIARWATRAEAVKDKKQLPAQFLEAWESKLAGEERAIALYCAMSQVWLAAGDLAKAQTWAKKGYEAMLGTEAKAGAATLDQLHAVCVLLEKADLMGEGREYPALASAMARLAGAGAFTPRHPALFGRFLGSDQTRAAFRGQLVDAQGQPRVAVGKALAIAYRGAWQKNHASTQVQQWRAYLAEQVGKSQGDAKALWLAISGYSDALTPEGVDWLLWRRPLDQALAAATSPAVKLAVLRDHVEFYQRIKRAEEGLKLLESVRGQFAGAELAELQKLSDQLKNQGQSEEMAFDAQQAEMARSRIEGQIGYYKNKLARAQAAGDAPAASAFQAKIDDLRKQLK